MDKTLVNLFNISIPDEKVVVTGSVVDWSFFDENDGQPGEPADWVKQRVRMYEKWQDELNPEILEDLQRSHRWMRNIAPPSTPKKRNPNEPPFDPGEFFDGMETDDDGQDR
jgi:hypothetical protein